MGANAPQPKPGSANAQAKGSPQAAAQPPQAAGQQKQSGEAFKLERPSMSVQQVVLCRRSSPSPRTIRTAGVKRTRYSKDALKGLMDSIKMQGGINTPLLLQARPDGTYEVGDGHRRFYQPHVAHRGRRGSASRWR